MTQNVSFVSTLKISEHAINRAVERLNCAREHAEHHIRQLLSCAAFHGEGANPQGKTEVYVHHKTRTSIVVSRINREVITVYGPEDSPVTTKLTVGRLAYVMKRELRLLTTQLRREANRLIEQQAELNVRIAELALNKARCKAPHTRELIQTRIDEVTSHVTALAQEIDAKLTEIKTAENEVKAVVGDA